MLSFSPVTALPPRPSQHISAGWAGRSPPTASAQKPTRAPPAVHPQPAGMPLSHGVGYLPRESPLLHRRSADTWYCYGNSHSHRGSWRECFRILKGPGSREQDLEMSLGRLSGAFQAFCNLGPTVPTPSFWQRSCLQGEKAPGSHRPCFSQVVQNKENLLSE